MTTATTGLAGHLYSNAQDPPGAEWRRSDARREVRSRIRIRLDGTTEHYGYAINVTPQTMCITCKDEMEPYSTIEICPADADTSRVEWDPALVIHNTQTLGGFKVGVKMR